MSSYDYANLCGNYLAILRDEKDHESDLKRRGYSEHQLKNVQVKKQSLTFKSLGLRFTKPLTKFEYTNLGYILLLFDRYEKGNLPYPGTICEQPAQIIEIFSTLKTIQLEHQRALEKEQQRPKSRRK